MSTAFKEYTDFAYFYPPRAEVKIPNTALKLYDNGQYVAQPKYNGSCALLFLNGKKDYRLFNRHSQELTLQRQQPYNDLNPTNNYMVLAGEYLNKNKKGEDGTAFNHKFIIWDILVNDGQHLVGSTVQERMNLLIDLYGTFTAAAPPPPPHIEVFDYLQCTHVPHVYTAPLIRTDFAEHYELITRTDLYEGLVIKRLAGKLEYGLRPANNTGWQLKCRKQTKNYIF